MAVVARHGHVPTRKREPDCVVAAQRESRRGITLDGMTILAAAVVRRPCELTFMDVRVAVQTLAVLETIVGARPGGDVAFGTGNGRVFPFQRVAGGGMLGHAEFRGLEPLDRVTGFTGAAVFARPELPPMRIRSVTVRAFPVGQRGVEHHAVVAGAAPHVGMLAQQRIVGPGVIKDGAHSRPRHFLPRRDVVAGIAVGFEAPPVRIGVTRRTSVEGQSDVFGGLRLARRWLVTLLARHPQVRAEERIFGFRMVESRRAFPLREGVASKTVLA